MHKMSIVLVLYQSIIHHVRNLQYSYQVTCRCSHGNIIYTQRYVHHVQDSSHVHHSNLHHHILMFHKLLITNQIDLVCMQHSSWTVCLHRQLHLKNKAKHHSYKYTLHRFCVEYYSHSTSIVNSHTPVSLLMISTLPITFMI